MNGRPQAWIAHSPDRKLISPSRQYGIHAYSNIIFIFRNKGYGPETRLWVRSILNSVAMSAQPERNIRRAPCVLPEPPHAGVGE